MRKITVILTTLGFIFAFSYFFHTNLGHYQGNIYVSIEDENEAKLKKAGFWEVNQIDIDDTNPTKNWSITQATYDWCSGSGTEGDPYIIENVTIERENSGYGIIIMYSSAFFIIRNCTVYNSGYGYSGLYLNYVDNGKILNNTISFNGDHGIFFQGGGNNNIVSNNTVINNLRAGIDFESFYDYNTISGNIVTDNGQYGIVLRQDCDNNVIRDNVVYNSGNTGIMLQGGSDNNNVTENIVSSSWRGVMIYGNSNYNIIKRNDISKSNSSGVHIEESQSNTVNDNLICDNNGNGVSFESWVGIDNADNNITGNIIKGNLGTGVSIDEDSFNNLIYRNEFINNNINAEDNGVNNQWDNGTIGNFWSDYFGLDLNYDGIGDTPYVINGSSGSQDNYPLSPSYFIINFPAINQIYGSIAPEFNIEIYIQSLNTSWYTIDAGLTNVSFTTNTSINQVLWNATNDGIIGLTFYANDTAGNLNFTSVNIIKDTTSPSVTLISPKKNEVFGAVSPFFNILIKDPNIDKMWYTIDGGFTNITFTTNTSINQDLWNAANYGTVVLTFYANDTVGNINFTSISIIKDTNPPEIPGYDLLIFVGFISAFSIIIFNKRLKLLSVSPRY